MRQGSIFASKLKSKEDQVRGRTSYSKWKALTESVRHAGSVAAVLRCFHNFMDANHLYGTEQQAGWGEQSLNLLIQDENLEDEHLGLV